MVREEFSSVVSVLTSPLDLLHLFRADPYCVSRSARHCWHKNHTDPQIQIQNKFKFKHKYKYKFKHKYKYKFKQKQNYKYKYKLHHGRHCSNQRKAKAHAGASRGGARFVCPFINVRWRWAVGATSAMREGGDGAGEHPEALHMSKKRTMRAISGIPVLALEACPRTHTSKPHIRNGGRCGGHHNSSSECRG